MASMASIPVEILILIFSYLNCVADLTSVAGVCKGWRYAVRDRIRSSQQQEPPQLPWLLQPSLDAPPSTITSFVSGTTGRRIRLPEGVRRRDRFCGSHEGGWVAVATDRRGPGPYYYFVNLINQQATTIASSIPLPSTLLWYHATGSEEVELRMVTLSDAPTAGSCIAAAHTVGGYPSIVFCRPHVDGHWTPPLMDTEPLQDTLYHSGEVYQGFYAISNMDNLYVFQPMEINNGETLVMRQTIISFPPVMLAMGQLRMPGGITTRYLVESRGKLLLVLRYLGRATGIDLRTLHFRVFELEMYPMPNAAGGHFAAWIELHGLDGRIITVARGCSRAYEVAQHKAGFEGGCIYYLDDAAGGGRMNNSSFSFADLGMYSMGDTKIERPGLPAPALRGSLDQGTSSAPSRHPSKVQATEHDRQRWLLRPRLPAAASNSPYGPRELLVRTIHIESHATEEVITSRLQMVSDTDHIANDEEASSSTSAGGEQVAHETLASVWPLLCKRGNHRPVWFMPPSAGEWIVLHPAAADDA